MKGIPYTELSSSDNIYHSNYSTKVFSDEFNRSTRNYEKSRDPWNTGIINGSTMTNFDHDRYPRPPHKLSNKLLQREKDIYASRDRIQDTWTTRNPSSTSNMMNTNNNIQSFDLTGYETFSSLRGPSMRHRMDPVEFEKINSGPDIYASREPKVHDKGSHNNMEPFFSGNGTNQNMNPDTNRTFLEHMTGTDVVFDHKKEIAPMFPLIKDPWAVGGQPVMANRELERYIPSIYKSNVLPFNQLRVAPGLNKDTNTLSSNIGFHDPYRPLGLGEFKDVNSIRVNPKTSYSGRIVGEHYFIPLAGVKTAPVISRSNKNTYYTTDPNLVNSMDGKQYGPRYDHSRSTSAPMYRDLLVSGPGTYYPSQEDPDTIVLKNVTRPYTSDISELPGPCESTINHHQSYPYDKARSTINEQTEDHTYSRINAIPEVNRRQMYYYDKAKETINEQTEDHVNSMINALPNVNKGMTYNYDKARETINEQTEDHVNSMINPNPEINQSQMYYFDKAKETINEQTEDHVNSIINPLSEVEKPTMIATFMNAIINGLKEVTMYNRAPVTEGTKINQNKKNIGILDTKKQQFTTYDYTKGYDSSVSPMINDPHMIGNITKDKATYADADFLNKMIHPSINQAFKNNPYTQSLSSWMQVHNPPFPSISH